MTALLPYNTSLQPFPPTGRETADTESPLPLFMRKGEFPPAWLIFVLSCQQDIPSPVAGPLPSARLGAIAEGTGLADMPNGTCRFCYAREDPDASQVFVGKVLLQGRARNTSLSIFLVYSSAGARQPCAQHPANLVLPSTLAAVLISSGFPCTSTVLPTPFGHDRRPC